MNSYRTDNYTLCRYMYPISLAEQDFFTNLGFTHPDLFQVLPCHFNTQFSIQVTSTQGAPSVYIFLILRSGTGAISSMLPLQTTVWFPMVTVQLVWWRVPLPLYLAYQRWWPSAYSHCTMTLWGCCDVLSMFFLSKWPRVVSWCAHFSTVITPHNKYQ